MSMRTFQNCMAYMKYENTNWLGQTTIDFHWNDMKCLDAVADYICTKAALEWGGLTQL